VTSKSLLFEWQASTIKSSAGLSDIPYTYSGLRTRMLRYKSREPGMNPSSRAPSPKERGRLWPASVRWLFLISAYEVDLLQLQLAQGFAGMPRVAGTVRSIILCVRNLSSADVLMTINITLVYHSWATKQFVSHRIAKMRHKKISPLFWADVKG